MKTIVTMICGIALLVSSALPCFAAGDSGWTTIKSVQMKETGAIFLQTTAAHNNPDLCEQDDYLVILPTNLLKKELMAMALTAMSSPNSMIGAWTAGCYSRYNTTWPVAATLNIKN